MGATLTNAELLGYDEARLFMEPSNVEPTRKYTREFLAGLDVALQPYQVTLLEKIVNNEDLEFKLIVPRRGASYMDKRFAEIWYELKASAEMRESIGSS